MMKLIFVIVTLISYVSVSAEVIDSVQYQFDYIVSIRPYEEANFYNKDVYHLQIGKNGVSKFFSPRYERSKELKDSILRVGMTPDEAFELLNKEDVFNTTLRFMVFKNHPKESVITETDNIGGEYLSEEKMPQINWTYEKSDSIILGYSCKKASTTFRGTQWNVWYALDIPIHNGPWKLSNLPGMILLAESTDKHFQFRCIKADTPKQGIITYNSKLKYTRCSTKELSGLRLRWEKNQMGFVMQVAGFDEDIVSAKKQSDKTPCLLEKY